MAEEKLKTASLGIFAKVLLKFISNQLCRNTPWRVLDIHKCSLFTFKNAPWRVPTILSTLNNLYTVFINSINC